MAATLNSAVTRLSDTHPRGSYTSFPIRSSARRLTLASGTAQAGDSFLVQPTRTGARDMDVLVLDPAKVAAASPIVTGNSAGNQGSGKLGAATVDPTYPATPLAANLTLSYDAATGELSGFPAASAVTVTLANGTATTYAAGAPVPYTAGAQISFDGLSMAMTGTPANGDTFTIGKNAGGVSDGSNALLLGALQRQATIGNGATTFNGAYSQLVSEVGKSRPTPQRQRIVERADRDARIDGEGLLRVPQEGLEQGGIQLGGFEPQAVARRVALDAIVAESLP